MYYDVFKELNSLDESYELEENFEIHSELNQKLFDGNVLREDVRKQLIKIANTFIDSIKEDQIPIKVYDYWLVGSNASYNYSDSSDIDVHVIVDTNGLGLNPYLISLLYNYIKSSFNDKYDIKIKGHEVELYLEDIETSAVTNGIYSLMQDKWIKEPIKSDETISYDVTETELWQDWFDRYQFLNDREAEQFLDDLYMMRKMSLANEGEWGLGNLIFKEFRNRGYLDELKSRKYKYRSDELTLEKLEESLSKKYSGQTELKNLVFQAIPGIDGQPREYSIHHLNNDHDDMNFENIVMLKNGAHTSLHNKFKKNSRQEAISILNTGYYIKDFAIAKIDETKANDLFDSNIKYFQINQE